MSLAPHCDVWGRLRFARHHGIIRFCFCYIFRLVTFIDIIRWWRKLPKGWSVLILFSKLWYQKYWFDIVFSLYRTYLLSYYLYINIWPISGLNSSNTNVFESIMNLLNIIALTCFCFSLSKIQKLVVRNKA